MKEIFLKAIKGWTRHQTQDKAAALTFFSLLSFAPIVLLLLNITKLLAIADQSPQQVVRNISRAFPPETSDFIAQFALRSFETANIWVFLGTLLFLLWTASALVDGLDRAINRIFEVAIDDEKGNLLLLAKKKGMSLLFVLLFVLALILSFILPTYFKFFFDANIVTWLEYISAGVLFTTIFTVLLRWLPHVIIPWKEAVLSGILLAFVTILGKTVMSFIFGLISFTNDFSVGGAIILFLIWINYTWSILLLGIELIHAWLDTHRNVDVKQYATRL